MLFNSIDFAIFFPVCFLLYWFAFSKTVKRQNIFLIISSLFFYGYWNWKFLGLLLFVAFLCYYGGSLISFSREQNKYNWAKLILGVVVVINVCLLFYFKYFNFFIQSFIRAYSFFGSEVNIGLLHIILPVGISFYIFTGLSYTIDVFRGATKHTKDIISYLAYILFFPCLFSGPISRSDDQLPQYFSKRTFSYDFVVTGCKLILWGLFMKLCVADRLGLYVDAVYNNIPRHNGTSIGLATFFYSIQLYTDFGGYSLIAKGVGNCFGISLKDNFIRPYLSSSFSEYWKRNHMSLTNWLMDYVYYPLVGSSSRLVWWNLCMIITFLVSGLWHGAAFTFILWGLYQGFWIVLDSNTLRKRTRFEKKHNLKNKIWWRVFSCCLTFFIIYWGLIFFRANTVSDAIECINKICLYPGDLFLDVTTMTYGSVCSMILLFKDVRDEFYGNKLRVFDNKRMIVRWIGYITIVLCIILFGAFEGGAFIYFQF